jgi:L,D-transpeptidase YcbB
MRRYLPSLLLGLLWLIGGVVRAADPPAAPAMTATPDPVTVGIATLLNGTDTLLVDGERLDVRMLRGLYEPRGYHPLWTGRGDAAKRGKEVAAAIDRAAAHGLNPATYHRQAIGKRMAATTPADRAALDVLASDGLMHLFVHLRVGAIPARAVGGDIAFEARPVDPQGLAEQSAAAPDLSAFVDGVAPSSPAYRGLVEALARYRAAADAGGWPPVPTKGPNVTPGMSDAVVPLVRQRLAATGELEASAEPEGDPKVYDDELAEAVKAFQARNGLPKDGTLGAATRAALAVPVGDRISQIMVNLERARWLPEDLGRRYVAVNVPAFDLRLVENGKLVLEMPVVVGRTDRPTPLLATEITEVIFNPTWTVPPTLLKKDFLPRMQRNQSFLAKRGIQVVSHRVSGGNPVGRVTLRQPPGPKNPLGRVKFHMPNGFAVYLHDTNAKYLMQQPRRALSSGCVRVGNALGLADQLLLNDARWTTARRKQFLSDWTTRSLPLRDPVPIYILYQTAWADEHGQIHSRVDLYGRDVALAKALSQTARSRLPST